MSPEVRLFLQAGVEALEDAGYSRETIQRQYQGDVGVLVGTMSNHYNLYGFQNNLTRGAPASGSYTGTLPNMLSYFYGLTGPSIFLDTMCSASSTCIHQAVQMLRARECRMVVAGGVNLLLHPYNLITSSQEHFTTATSDVIRSFGRGADGTILGEGVGAVVLKPLVEAERDGDHIHAVIKGTALTNAGVRNGFTVPNPPYAGEGDREGDRRRGRRPADDRLCRGARLGHVARRPDRGQGTDHGLPEAHRGHGVLRPRLGEVEHGSPPRGRGNGRLREGGPPAPEEDARPPRSTAPNSTRTSTSPERPSACSANSPRGSRWSPRRTGGRSCIPGAPESPRSAPAG
ncbi:hypothetical protein GCM10020000_12130 [Streptomyces olivoverticillatus]